MASLFPCTVTALQTHHWSLLKVVECKLSPRTWKEVSSIYFYYPRVTFVYRAAHTVELQLLYLDGDGLFSAQTETHRYRAWTGNVCLLVYQGVRLGGPCMPITPL